MENNWIKDRIQQALDCVQGVEEPYRTIAFQVILTEILREEAGSEKEHGKQGEPSPELKQRSFPPINEFYYAVHPKAYTEAVVTIAYYLLHAEKISLFTIQEIADRLSKCRAEKPRNLSDVLAGCARNGWLAEGDQKQGGMKSWYLTQSGEKYLELKLDRNP